MISVTLIRDYTINIDFRRLKMVRPVCECKYERKIVERNEERTRWKTRQRRLKTLKKQPFMHVADISRPMVKDTKFIISDVKRIPQQNEDENDVEYCIAGVAENLIMSPPEQIIDGLKMSTPFATPKPSKEDILRAAPHCHWSPMDIPPGPLPTRRRKEMERKKRVRDEAFKLIYGDKDEQDASCPVACHDCQEVCNQEKPTKEFESDHKTGKNNASVERKLSGTLIKLPSSSLEKTSQRTGNQQNASLKEIVSEVTYEKKKHSEKTAGSTDRQQSAMHKQMIEKTERKNDSESRRVNGDGDGRSTVKKLNLIAITKVSLNSFS